MPRAVAGQDFLGSVGDLFDEVQHKQPGHDGFALFRKQLVDLLLMLSEMKTAAKTRANSPVKLPDGKEPETHIQSTPATLKVDASLARRLSGAPDPAGFKAILSEARGEQVPSRSRKRKIECDAGNSTPRKRITSRKTGLVPRTPGSPEQPATPISIGPPMMDLDDDVGGRFPSPPATNAVVKMDIQKSDEAVLSPSAFIKKVTQKIVPRTEQEIIGVVGEASEALTTDPVPEQRPVIEMADNNDDDGDEGPEGDYEMEDATDLSMVADFSISSFNNTVSPFSPVSNSTTPKPDVAAEEVESAETLKQIIADVRNTTPKQWEAFRPKLLDSLLPYAEMEYAKLSSLGPTVTRDALTRLDAAIARLGDDISVIPADNWQRYKQRLHKLCGAQVFSTYDYAQRLRKVMDVMYLDEEADAMESGDWDRLEVVVKIIATVCEAMGPVEEESAEVSHKWFRSKVQDIRFLKRIMTSINRKTEVLQV